MLFTLASIAWTVLWWWLAWGKIPLLSEYSFFPLWIGYILTINSLSELFYKDSLVRRLGGSFLFLFVASIPLWWFFEWTNSYLQNWHYIFLQSVSQLHFAIQASIDFSTVIPAVLSTAFLFNRVLEHRKAGGGNTFTTRGFWLGLSMGIGFLFFTLMPIFPHQVFPLVWIAPFLILEPFLYASGLPSLLKQIERGDWTLTLSVLISTLLTGFFWEMWNFFSLPKWYYIVPYVGFGKVFEMPILGYGGYPPFGLIVLSYTVFVFYFFLRKDLFLSFKKK